MKDSNERNNDIQRQHKLSSPVEVGADAVEHFAAELVFLPLDCVELQHGLVHQVGPVLEWIEDLQYCLVTS